MWNWRMCAILNVFLYNIQDTMNAVAEPVQYFCANTQLKTFNEGWTPLTPSRYTSALIHGVKEIQSSIWPAVSQLLLMTRERETEKERERFFIRIKQATKRDMPIKPGAYCLATYQWYSIQTKIEQKRKAKGEKCNTKATKTQEYGKYSTMNEYRLSVC